MLPKAPAATDPNDLVLNVLRDDGAEKRSLARAKQMMEWYAAGTARFIDEGPGIEELRTGMHTSTCEGHNVRFRWTSPSLQARNAQVGKDTT